MLSLALRCAFFVLVAFYSSNDPQSNSNIIVSLHDFNDLVGIVLLTVILVFVGVVVDRLVTYRYVCLLGSIELSQ